VQNLVLRGLPGKHHRRPERCRIRQRGRYGHRL